MRGSNIIPCFVAQIIWADTVDAGIAAACIAPKILQQRTFFIDVGHHPFFTNIVKNNGFDLDLFLILRLQMW
ncbi:hypothetical protein D3C75_1108930 [compost metagenome]